MGARRCLWIQQHGIIVYGVINEAFNFVLDFLISEEPMEESKNISAIARKMHS